MEKKALYLCVILVLCLGFAAPAAAGEPQPGQPGDTPLRIFLPLVVSSGLSYDVSGQVRDAQDIPLAGVMIQDNAGNSTVTEVDGTYQMKATAGNQVLTASKEGFNFLPASASLDVNQNLSGLDFTAVAACANVIPNPGFETLYFYWNPISGNANGYTPYYSNDTAASGLYSGFTGIRPGELNKISWSRWRTHEIAIPASASSANLTLSMWPRTSESLILKPEIAPPTGFDTESPDAPEIAGDGQYAAVIDPSTNVVLEWLFWKRRNDQAWLGSSPISLAGWAGHTIKIEFGTYNDGYGATYNATSAYFDDINLTVCDGGIGTLTCSNILLNSNFEGAGGWVARPANIPSVYSFSYYYSPLRSAKNGVDPLVINPFPYQWTTSEFIQAVTIPATAYSARLRMFLRPRSNQYPYDARPKAAELELSEKYDPKALAAAEAQYSFVMDPTGTVDYRMLFKWYADHSYTWRYREFDLLDYRGWNISILFGAANDGWGGNTALYVDDVTLEVCTP